jgi:hypothetical protein
MRGSTINRQEKYTNKKHEEGKHINMKHIKMEKSA